MKTAIHGVQLNKVSVGYYTGEVMGVNCGYSNSKRLDGPVYFACIKHVWYNYTNKSDVEKAIIAYAPLNGEKAF